MIRSAASLRRVPVGRVPRLHQYYQRTPTSRRPSRRTSFSCAWRYHAAALFAPAAVGRSPGRDCCLPRPSIPHLRWRRRVLPGSCATRAGMPRSRTPAEPAAPDHLGAAMVPSALVTASASAMFTNFVAQSRGLQGFLCTLRRQRHHWPRNTRFRLAGQPWPVRTRTCWVAKKVSVMSQHVFPLHQASPGARQASPLLWKTRQGNEVTAGAAPLSNEKVRVNWSDP